MKIKQILWFTVLTLLYSQTLARSYPIKDIPIIENANYEQYRHNETYRKTYTMLQGTTYYDWRDMWLWSHQGIDIAKPGWTPIQAIHSGTIILAEHKWARWRVITIEHEFKWQKIYSSYAHLQDIYVMKWEQIKEGEIIATVGQSWNSTWPHLHFQIEIKSNGEHPFFFKNCEWTISQIINEWRCKNQMYEYTIDPILFIESNGDIVWTKTNQDEENNTWYKIWWFLWWILPTKQIWAINISSDNIQILNEPITFSYNKNMIKLFPEKIEILTSQRKIFITPEKTWLSYIKILQWKELIEEFPIYISQDITQISHTKILNIQQYKFYITQLNDDKTIFFKYKDNRLSYIYHNKKFQKL